MRLKFTFLATAAETSSDGKFSVVGGDFNTVSASGFPAVHPQLAAVIKLYANPNESGIEQTVVIRLVGPGGILLGESASRVRPIGNPIHPDRDSEVGLVSIFQFVPLTGPGEYAVEIRVGDETLGDARFDVFLRPQQPPPTEAQT